MTVINVSSGQTSSGIILSGSDVMNVFSGGTASDTTVLSGGTENVLSGGIAVGTILSAGGVESVTNDAVDSGAIVSSGGTLIATQIGASFIGPNANGDTVLSGGVEIALSGGWFQSANILGGSGIVSAGGFAQLVTVASGGVLTVLPNAGMSAGFVGANIVSVGNGGSMTVSAGAVAIQITISGGGTLTVLGEASAAVQGGGVEIVSSGGVASRTEVGSGGLEQVFSGGVAIGAVVTSFGLEEVFFRGVASGTVISNFGLEDVFSGGVAIGMMVSSGGLEEVFAGGVASGTVISGGGVVDVGGSGVVNRTVVSSGGVENVLDGGVASGTVISGGVEIVSSGGTVVLTTIGTSGSLDLLSGAIVSGAILMSGSSGSLIVADAATPTNPIDGFVSAGDSVDLQALAFSGNTSVGFNSATDVLTVTEGGASATIQLDSENYTGVSWLAKSDGGSGTDVTTTLCFCRGTMILTDKGEVAVEELAVGDRVVTVAGAVKPIQWIGFGRDEVTRGNKPARPVIVRQGALADNVPARELHLTHGHALYLHEVLIPVENLVNHRSILWDDEASSVEYYHIELADHDVVLANGAPAETYYDAGNRASFSNTRPFSRIGTTPPTVAPVLNGGDIVEAAWAELFARAGGTIEAETTDDPDLHLVVDGRRLDPAVGEDGAFHFAFDAPPSAAVSLGSRSGVPSLLGISRHDHRRLGVALGRITLRQAGTETTVDHDAALLRDGGCHPAEIGYSWTDGELELPPRLFTHLRGAFTLSVHIERPGMRYPTAGPVEVAA